MKKSILIYILIIALSSISCSSDDDSNNTNSNSINPPEWIQGTWLIQNGNSTGQSGYKFTTDDFILISLNFESSFKDQVVTASSAGATSIVNEIINEDEYKITITLTSQTINYFFERKTDNIIEWTNDPLGELSETLYIKQ